MARTHYPGRLAAEREFPHRVDVPVPGDGLGRRLTDMLDWCREHVAADTWGQHHHSERRKGEAPRDFARFYFVTEKDAEAFRREWSDATSMPRTTVPGSTVLGRVPPGALEPSTVLTARGSCNGTLTLIASVGAIFTGQSAG